MNCRLPLPFSVLLCCSVLAGAVSTSAQAAGLFGGDKPPRVELTASSDKTAAFTSAFSDSGVFAHAIKPFATTSKKVVIAGFQAEFATEQANTATARGSTDVTKVYFLKGVEDSVLQKITDDLLAAFTAKLQARGYEVLPVEALAKTGYKEALAAANQPPQKQSRSDIARALGWGTKEVDQNNASIVVSAKGTAPDVFGLMMSSATRGTKAADELGANILHVRLKVNFARFEDSGSWGFSEIDDKPQNMLGVSGTKIQLFAPGGNLTELPLKKSVLLPGRIADKATEIVATTAETSAKVAKSGIAVAAGFFGIGNNGSGLAGAFGTAAGELHAHGGSGNYEVVAGKDYADKVGADLSLSMDMLVEVLPAATAATPK